MNKFSLLCAVAAIAAPASSYAQQITSEIQGQVSDRTGAAVARAVVTITDMRTGASRNLTSDSEGRFSARGLTAGGPYSVTAAAPGFQGQTVEGLITTTQGSTSLSFNLEAAGTAGGDEIIVTAQRANVQLRAIGPGQAFGEEVLENLPTITNDIRDIIRIDPRVSLDRDQEVDRVSCLGANDRANTFTVDGQVQADVFGLNGTPFASRNALPLPYGAIRQTSVEFAPFDVQYGQFTGCAINVVTRSGENQFHGGFFGSYTSDDLQGDKVGDEEFEITPYKEKRWGATLGGPIVRDRLFFFGGYEETRTPGTQEQGPTGAGFPNTQTFVTEAQFNEVSEILSANYGLDTGGLARSLPESNRRFFGRLDWLVNDDHRLELTYQRLDETSVSGSGDIGNSSLAGYNNFTNRGTKSNYYSGRIFSQWNDAFSTEVRLSKAEVKDIQDPIGGGDASSENPTPRFVVGVSNIDPQGVLQRGSIVAGPGFSQAANDLYTEVLQGKLVANYEMGGHTFTAGMEVNELDAFNLFVQNATGTLTFNSIADLRNGLISNGTNTNPNRDQVGLVGTAAGAYINSSFTGDIDDAAAAFKRTIWSAYVQDRWRATDALTILGGVRVDWVSGDAPPENEKFVERYGFSNAVGFDALDAVVMPRLAVTYDMEPGSIFSRTQLRAGVGIFSGGDPAVWFSNAFSNTGRNFGQGIQNNALCNGIRVGGRIDVLQNGTFTGFPQCVAAAGQAQGNQGLADTQSIDPSIKMPTVLRANLGLATNLNFSPSDGFFDNWRVNLDYIYSRFRNPYTVVDLSQTLDIRNGLTGLTIDGRPIYASIDPTVANCNAELEGTGGAPPVFNGVTAPCFSTSRDDELQLTNSDDAFSHVASVILSKRFDGGIFTAGGSSFLTAGYSYTDSDDRRSMGNSTATSNYDNSAYFDRQDPELGTSIYESRHNFTLAGSTGNQFFGDFETRLGFVFVAREGRPYSVTFGGSGVFNDSASGFDNALLYVPTGLGDPNVVYSATTVGGVLQTAAQAEQSFNDYIDDNKCISRYRGETLPRNSCRNDWYYDMDLQFSQELPGPANLIGVKDRMTLFANFDNFLNFLDSGWNTFRRRNNNGLVNIIDATSINAQGKYVLGRFNPDDQEDIQLSSSLWRIQVGIRYAF